MFSKTHMIYCIVLSVLTAGCVTTPAGRPAVDSEPVVVGSGSVVVESEDFRAAIVFGENDRRKIRDYYRSNYKSKALPPGLAKKSELHPGLRNHIRKYGQLPPGIEGKGLPMDLERTLRHLPEGYVRVRIGGDILLMNESSRYVLDVMFDVD